MRNRLALASGLALALLATQPCPAQDAPAPRSIAEISARWEKLRPSCDEIEAQDEFCDFGDDFAIGKVKPGYVQDGVNMLNFIRYLLVLPDDVVADPDLNRRAQALTAVSAMNGYHSHSPEYPEGMPAELFKLAFAAGPKSNLLSANRDGKASEAMWFWMRERWGEYPALAQNRRYQFARSVLTLVADADTRNVFDAEHRRNIFRPQNAKVGFGFLDFYEDWDATAEMAAQDSPGGKPVEGKWWGYKYQQFTTMYSVDPGRASMPKFDYLTWPVKGYMPLQFWKVGSPAHPWSVTLNPALYKIDKSAALSVEIAAAKGPYKVRITTADKLATFGQIGDDDLDKDGKLKKFMYVQPATASWLPAILFFPGEAAYPEPASGERYRVTIGGLKDAKGAPTTLSYWVEFFSLPHTGWIDDPAAED